mmetsp:Transcript_26168/g.42889  ORF Transcript_26168/g.42889 Transcript_26168/m.42889 type:complete len:371 (+) Transcript_26168:182-1294(+)
MSRNEVEFQALRGDDADRQLELEVLRPSPTPQKTFTVSRRVLLGSGFAFLLVVLIVVVITANQSRSGSSTVGPRSTGPLIPQGFSFAAVGDWGRKGDFHQSDVANLMGLKCAERLCDFIVSVGDNFYDNGVKNVKDSLWYTSFESIYKHTSLQAKWYVVLGNHDYRGNAQAQVDYSMTSPRWHMPARYYQSVFDAIASDGTRVKMAMFYLDTNPFIQEYRTEDKYTQGDLLEQDTAQQLAWLRKALSAAGDADWKIVVAHHPVYSAAGHGDTHELIDQLQPILVQTGVDLYICGHDHDLQHIKKDESKVHYFVSGAGSETRDEISATNSLRWQSIQSGFMLFSLKTKDVMTMEAFTWDGVNPYTATIARP